ncbi:MAG: glycoside hydrolase family 88 protein [Planctomycetes bacterium]|nr:glycoside hydrolase family 88 protein [Planctomycetota bacterium]
MKRVLLLGVLTCIFCQSCCSEGTKVACKVGEPVFDREETVAVMRKVCDWQLANFPDKALVGRKWKPILNNGWIRGAFFTGEMATYYTTGDEKYLNAAIELSEKEGWLPAPRLRHADDHCIGQTYAEIYFIKKDPKMIAPIVDTFDKIMAEPKAGRVDWWWCDALFMAPPAMARIAVATGEQKYFDFMNEMWWDTTEFLYDTDEHLYYRDKRYKVGPGGNGKLSPHGKKIFWSRGNGWVMGGMVRVLQYMPKDYPDRGKYIKLFKEMAAKIASLQGKDGLWRTSLLEAQWYPTGETSGSGFFCYALAWGINEGILERGKYLAVVKKSWKALVDAVDENGKLGWVQLVGHDPRSIKKEDSMEYATGAFLLAGSEVVKLRK